MSAASNVRGVLGAVEAEEETSESRSDDGGATEEESDREVDRERDGISGLCQYQSGSMQVGRGTGSETLGDVALI